MIQAMANRQEDLVVGEEAAVVEMEDCIQCSQRGPAGSRMDRSMKWSCLAVTKSSHHGWRCQGLPYSTAVNSTRKVVSVFRIFQPQLRG